MTKPHRECAPRARTKPGGRGAGDCAAIAFLGTFSLGFREGQLDGRSIVVENFRVTAPLQRSFQLAMSFFFAEMLIEQIMKEFSGKRSIGFSLERLFHLT